MSQVLVRKAVETDWESMVVLIGQLGYAATRNEMADRFQAIVSDPQQHQILVAERDLKSVGLVHLQIRNTLMADSYVEIVSLVTDEALRGQGIGTALIVAAEEWALGLNCNLMQLYSNALRGPAHQFYYQNGYLKVKDSVMLQKSLKSPHRQTLSDGV